MSAKIVFFGVVIYIRIVDFSFFGVGDHICSIFSFFFLFVVGGGRQPEREYWGWGWGLKRKKKMGRGRKRKKKMILQKREFNQKNL